MSMMNSLLCPAMYERNTFIGLSWKFRFMVVFFYTSSVAAPPRHLPLKGKAFVETPQAEGFRLPPREKLSAEQTDEG